MSALSFLRKALRIGAPMFLLAGIVVGALLINRPFGGKLFASFVNAEGAFSLWTARGWSLPATMAISLACSTYDLVMWIWMFAGVHVLLERAEAFEKRFVGVIPVIIAKQTRRQLFLIRRLLFLFAMRPSTCHAIMARHRRQVSAVAFPAIALMGFIPGCIWPALFLISSLELPATSSFLALACGNAIKVTLFGSIGSHVAGHLLKTARFGHVAAVGTAFVVIVTGQRMLERWARRRWL